MKKSIIISFITFWVTWSIFWILVHYAGANMTDYTMDDYRLAAWITAGVTAAINFFRTLLEDE